MPAVGNFLHFPMYQPQRVRWVGEYCEPAFIVNRDTVNFRGIVFRSNSLRDPRAVEATGQKSVFGFGTMKSLYDIYRVYKMQIYVRWMPGSDVDGTADSTGYFDGQALYLEVGKSFNTFASGPFHERVTDACVDRFSGAARSFGVDFQGMVQALMCNGAKYQGANRWRMINPPGSYSNFTRPRDNSTKLAAEYKVWQLASESQSFRDWAADKDYESLMTRDPDNGQFVGVGWCNTSSQPAVVGGRLMVKIKYHSILSRPHKIALQEEPVAPDPAGTDWDAEHLVRNVVDQP